MNLDVISTKSQKSHKKGKHTKNSKTVPSLEHLHFRRSHTYLSRKKGGIKVTKHHPRHHKSRKNLRMKSLDIAHNGTQKLPEVGVKSVILSDVDSAQEDQSE